ncbi:MAG: nuclear transport factor 2 family protein [Gemmatimonadales bacterium]
MTTTKLDIRSLEKELNEMILEGKILEAFDKFYADDVTMQENTDPPREGKATNREFEIAFLESFQEFHSAELVTSATGKDVSLSEWVWDVTFKEGGRVHMAQVATRRWKDGKVASERFYYNKG